MSQPEQPNQPMTDEQLKERFVERMRSDPKFLEELGRLLDEEIVDDELRKEAK